MHFPELMWTDGRGSHKSASQTWSKLDSGSPLQRLTSGCLTFTIKDFDLLPKRDEGGLDLLAKNSSGVCGHASCHLHGGVTSIPAKDENKTIKCLVCLCVITTDRKVL